MFSGIVEDVGYVESFSSSKLKIRTSLGEMEEGDSLMVDGVCLTVSRFSSGRVWMDVGLETLRKSAGRIIRAGSRVNLERSLSLASRIHGHIVYGHVMCTGKVAKIIKKSNTKIFNIESSESFTSKLIEKGSVAVNGVSLTVNEISGGSFWVAVIPQTLKRSNLGDLRHSKVVNLEADMLVAALRQGRV